MSREAAIELANSMAIDDLGEQEYRPKVYDCGGYFAVRFVVPPSPAAQLIYVTL